MFTEFKLLQPEKAPLPIDITEEGIVSEVNPLHLLKASLPIDVIEEGIITDINPLH